MQALVIFLHSLTNPQKFGCAGCGYADYILKRIKKQKQGKINLRQLDTNIVVYLFNPLIVGRGCAII